jgi:hypothetical protein
MVAKVISAISAFRLPTVSDRHFSNPRHPIQAAVQAAAAVNTGATAFMNSPTSDQHMSISMNI